MSLTALAKPTTLLVDPTLTVVATNLPTAAGVGSALSGTTGFTVPWVPGLVVVIAGGAAGTGAVTVKSPVTGVPTPAFTLPATSQTVTYGPIPQEFADPSTGLVEFDFTTVTNARAGAFILPNAGGTGTSHNPFQNNPTAGDF